MTALTRPTDLSTLSSAGRWIVRAATFAMAVVVLVWVVDHSRTSEAEVVVHVMEPDVVVTIGDQSFPIEGRRFAPIVCNVLPGVYDLVMRRGDCVLYEQRLEVGPGDHLVCTAWVPQPDQENPLPLPTYEAGGFAVGG
jgi:hypothetical protein